MSKHFSFLRIIPFEPKFVWVASTASAADYINRPHEDYPRRVQTTLEAIEKWTASTASFTKYMGHAPKPTSNLLKNIHTYVFSDFPAEQRGNWRRNAVRVGLHHPPQYEMLDKYMDELEEITPEPFVSAVELTEWYSSFETIHPFIDGNGRVGGVIVAIYSHLLFPNTGYLAPLQ